MIMIEKNKVLRREVYVKKKERKKKKILPGVVSILVVHGCGCGGKVK